MVVRSLLVGKVLKVDDVVGAANYWYESVAIVNVLKSYLGDRLLEIRYEDFAENPADSFKALCATLGLEMPKDDFADVSSKSKTDAKNFSGEDERTIISICEPYMRIYGYI